MYLPTEAPSGIPTDVNGPIELTMASAQRPSKIGRPGFEKRFQTCGIDWLESCVCSICER
jgi:hypothetical protein